MSRLVAVPRTLFLYIFPGQRLTMQELTGNTKKVYLMTKLWKARYPEASFKSYHAKKILLQPKWITLAWTGKEKRNQAFKTLLMGPLLEQGKPRKWNMRMYEGHIDKFVENCE